MPQSKLKVVMPKLKPSSPEEIKNEAEAEESEAEESDSETNAEEAETEATEIELLKGAGPEELYQLLSYDSEFYLKLIENYQSKDVNLGHELRCLISRNSNQTLNIKFKILPNDRWTEIGYFSDMSDKEVYEDFTSHVKALLSRSTAMIETSQRPHLELEIGETNDITSENYQGKPNQKIPEPDQSILEKEFGSQSQIRTTQVKQDYLKNLESPNSHLEEPSTSSKPRSIHNFGPMKHYITSPSAQAQTASSISNSAQSSISNSAQSSISNSAQSSISNSAQSSISPSIQVPQNYRKFPPKEVSESLSPPPLRSTQELSEFNKSRRPSLDQEIVAYKQQLIDNIAKKLPQILALNREITEPYLIEMTKLQSICPIELRAKYQQLITGLNCPQNQEFYRKLHQISIEAPQPVQSILKQFLADSVLQEPSRVYLDPYIYSHRDLIELLGLDSVDHRLIKEHNINLVRLWNQTI